MEGVGEARCTSRLKELEPPSDCHFLRAPSKGLVEREREEPPPNSQRVRQGQGRRCSAAIARRRRGADAHQYLDRERGFRRNDTTRSSVDLESESPTPP